MKPIYNDAKDLQVRKLVVYGKAADHKLYIDSAYTKLAAEADIVDAFDKGMLLIVEATGSSLPVFRYGGCVYTVGTKDISSTETPNVVADLVGWTVTAE